MRSKMILSISLFFLSGTLYGRAILFHTNTSERELKLEESTLTYSTLKGMSEKRKLRPCGQQNFTREFERLLKRPHRSCPQKGASITLKMGALKTRIGECQGALPTYESVLNNILNCQK